MGLEDWRTLGWYGLFVSSLASQLAVVKSTPRKCRCHSMLAVHMRCDCCWICVYSCVLLLAGVLLSKQTVDVII